MRIFAVLIALLGISLCASAQTLEAVASNYHRTPNARMRAALLRYAEQHRTDKDGALALFAIGVTEIDQRQFGDALQHLNAAGKRLPQLADYIGYLSAICESDLRTFPDAEKSLEPLWKFRPASPLVSKAVMLEANNDLDSGRAKEEITLVGKHREDLTGPQAELLLARGYEALGSTAEAVEHYRKIYSEYPLSFEAAAAAGALARYEPMPASVLLARGLKLVDGADYARASKELTAVLPQLSGADLELARVRIGAANYLARDYRPAYAHLTSFESSTPDVEAERLYYLMETDRRLDRISEMNATLAKLSIAFPHSRWRREALISAAYYYTNQKQLDTATDLFKTCAESFPGDPQSAVCDWRIAWGQYQKDPVSAEHLFEEHLKRYQDSDRTSSALYFLGRIAELKSNWGSARVYYEEIDSHYPNYYYAMLARERLQSSQIAIAPRSLETGQFIAALHLAPRPSEDFQSSPLTKQRIERAHMLSSAGLDDLAESELRFGAKVDGQPQIMALELAELANHRQSPDQAIRFIKHYAPDYLSLSLDSAPEKFWRLAFPLPYQKQLEEFCRPLSLDPFLVAALIRQESEFNPKAVSRSNARGLTQVMPSTGRELSRKLRIPRYQTSMLFTPETNLKIGTYYLKALSDQLEGKWEATLASYNAGKSRVLAWLGSGTFHEPAEFVESIPFNETRVYVQSVLRNAEVYRRLYGADSKSSADAKR
ncbi:MAG TPA: transglycosylase SLT domain-containing protein [Bryobacteraceae bacterium]|nr:transglycosylase SLT domain-containing protein [Bryobacteraceae bacterium]